jgi:alkylation response protein AidB-like acyl-CoA dehydrogenase
MDVRLSSEQAALRDSVAQVVDRLAPHAVGALDDAERAAKLDATVAAAGWRELRAAADAGGAPLASAVEAAIVAEELARGLADAAFLGPTLAQELRRLAGADPATAETVALTRDLSEPAHAVDGDAPATAIAVDALGAAAALVLAPAPGGYALATVEVPASDEPGGVDLTRPSRPLGPARAVTPVAGQARVVTPDDLTRWSALGLALTCADLVGAMRGAVALAVEYAKERKQYGTAIGSFQAVQHLLADAFVATEGSRSVALHAAWAVDALPADEASVAAAVAKAYCTRAARNVCEAAIQVHGGIGNTWECLAHVYLRRALLAGDTLGGVGPSLARVLDHHGIGGARGLR